MLYRILVVTILITLTVVYSVYQKKTLEGQLAVDSKSGSILKALPWADFENLDGSKFSLKKLYDETKPELVIVHFWGTWCAPCEAELPDLLALIKHYSTRVGIKFLLVAVNDDVQKVKKHIKGFAIPSDVQITWLLDNQSVFRDQFGTTRVPETFIFGSTGSTLRKFVGPQEWNKRLFFQTFDDFIQMNNQKM